MRIIEPGSLKTESLPGRGIRKAVGKDALSPSQKMTMGFARYEAAYGPMEPHHHAEEALFVVDARSGWVRFGPAPDALGEKVELKPGTILHVPELEWHVFGFEPGGYVEVVFFYGQVDNIRPEQTGSSGG